MGYSYRVQGKRRILSCDNCGRAEGDTRKVRCSVNYCPAFACCRECRAAGQVKNFRASCIERGCKQASADYHAKLAFEAKLLDEGKFVRCSALGVRGEDLVEVTFRNKTGAEKVLFMRHATYDSIPLGRPATPLDYEAFGTVQGFIS